MTPSNYLLDGIVTTQHELVLPGNQKYGFGAGSITYEGSRLHESIFQPSEYTHTFTTTQIDLVDRVLRQCMATTTPKIRFRWGVTRGSTHWFNWQNHVITSYSAAPQGTGDIAGYRVVIKTADEYWKASRLTKTAVRKGKISDIVAAIAKENGIETTIVEETLVSGVYYQIFQDDFEFMRDKLLPRSSNRKGLANYALYMQDSQLHFHTPEYATQVWTIDYCQHAGSDMIHTDRSQHAAPMGAAGVSVVRYDPYTGDSALIQAKPDVSLAFSDVLYPLTNLQYGSRNVPYHTGANGDREVQAIADSLYNDAKVKTFDLPFRLDRPSAIRPGHMVNLLASAAKTANSAAAGMHLVTSVDIDISNGHAISVYTLSRGETTKITGLKQYAGNANLEDVYRAPGTRVRMASTLKPGLRNASENNASDSPSTRLSDANKGPS